MWRQVTSPFTWSDSALGVAAPPAGDGCVAADADAGLPGLFGGQTAGTAGQLARQTPGWGGGGAFVFVRHWRAPILIRGCPLIEVNRTCFAVLRSV